MKAFVVAQMEGEGNPVFGPGPWGAKPIDLEDAVKMAKDMKAQGLSPVIYRLVKIEEDRKG